MANKNRDRSTEARQTRDNEVESERKLRELRARQELKLETEQAAMAEEATQRAKDDLELPDLIFDWSDLGWRESQQISQALMSINDAQAEYDERGNYIPREERERAQEQAFANVRLWFSRICVSVPLDWFTTSAQQAYNSNERDLDFTDPDTYLDLKEIRIGRLINALTESRANSEKN